jgi:hypothetical protein
MPDDARRHLMIMTPTSKVKSVHKAVGRIRLIILCCDLTASTLALGRSELR